MRSLFLKIFLWFWLAMLLVSLTLLISGYISESRSSQVRDEKMDRTMTPLIADNFVEIYDTQGKPGLTAFLEHAESGMPWKPFLFDARGEEVLGRIVSPEIRETFQLAMRNKQTEIVHHGNQRWVGQWLMSNSGKEYVLVLQLKPFPGPQALLRAPSVVQLLRFVTIALILGLISLWITRHITSPIFQLRQAANQLAKGNLAARVGPNSLQRNDELADLSKDFDYMATQIETLMASQQRLLADISHELRSPLARLSVALGLARRSSTPESASALNRIEREAQRLNELIGGLLQLARMESGDTIAREDFSLDALVKEVAEDADFEARSRNRSVRITDIAACRVHGNLDLLRSAIENVVRNAVNYTAENTEVLASLTCEEDSPFADIRVTDHGPGVSDAALANIFQPFYRVEVARDRNTGGTGLGLSITERAIRSHGGLVQAQNALNAGLQILLRLPRIQE